MDVNNNRITEELKIITDEINEGIFKKVFFQTSVQLRDALCSIY